MVNCRSCVMHSNRTYSRHAKAWTPKPRTVLSGMPTGERLWDGALFGEGENAVAPSLEQCQIDCAAQSIIDASPRCAFNGWRGV